MFNVATVKDQRKKGGEECTFTEVGTPSSPSPEAWAGWVQEWAQIM
jgi:hypothetical protein